MSGTRDATGREGSNELLIHLGCGKRYLPGYVHVDLAEYEHIDYRHDLRTLPMFSDGCADLIYSSHTLEYLDRVEVQEALREWRRVIKPGGMLRLAVPDFEALVEVYRRTGDLNYVIGPLYGRWPIPGSRDVVYHRTVYDERSLRDVLESAGFVRVRRWDWRTVFAGELNGFDDYSQAYFPHLRKDDGLLISLNIEATRPS